MRVNQNFKALTALSGPMLGCLFLVTSCGTFETKSREVYVEKPEPFPLIRSVQSIEDLGVCDAGSNDLSVYVIDIDETYVCKSAQSSYFGFYWEKSNRHFNHDLKRERLIGRELVSCSPSQSPSYIKVDYFYMSRDFLAIRSTRTKDSFAYCSESSLDENEVLEQIHLYGPYTTNGIGYEVQTNHGKVELLVNLLDNEPDGIERVIVTIKSAPLGTNLPGSFTFTL